VIQKGLLFSLNSIRREKLTGITSVRVVRGLLGVWRINDLNDCICNDKGVYKCSLSSG